MLPFACPWSLSPLRGPLPGEVLTTSGCISSSCNMVIYTLTPEVIRNCHFELQQPHFQMTSPRIQHLQHMALYVDQMGTCLHTVYSNLDLSISVFIFPHSFALTFCLFPHFFPPSLLPSPYSLTSSEPQAVFLLSPPVTKDILARTGQMFQLRPHLYRDIKLTYSHLQEINPNSSLYARKHDKEKKTDERLRFVDALTAVHMSEMIRFVGVL